MERYSMEKYTIDDYKKTAKIACLRKERFIDGFSVHDELIKLLTRFYSNKEKIERTGLRFVYQNLKTYVDEYCIIGYIIYGSYLGCDGYSNDIIVGKYTTQIGLTINLKVSEICRILLEEYYTEEELIESCKKTPNFNNYLKQI